MPFHGANLHLRIHQARRANHLFHYDAPRLRQLVRPRRRRDVDHLIHAVFELFEGQRPIVQRRGHSKTVVHQRLLARAVAVEHSAHLPHGLVRFIDEHQKIVRDVVQQCWGRFSRQPAAQVAGIVFDAVAVADGAHHLDVKHGALDDALGFDEFPLLLQLLFPPPQLFLDGDDGTVALFLRHDVVRLRENRHLGQIFLPRVHFARERIDLPDGIDLLAPHLEPESFVLIGGVDLNHVAAHAKCSAPQIFRSLVLNVHQPAEQGLPRSLLPLLQGNEHSVIGFGRADAVNAGNGGDDDDVAPFEQRARRAHAQLVQLIVDRRFLVDVNVRGGNVGFRLVKIVVADEIFDGVFREKSLEFVIKLRGERLVMRQNQRGAVRRLDQLGHRERFAGTGHAQEHLVLFARFHAAIELFDGRGLISARLIVAVQLKFHGKGLLPARRALPKPSLYSSMQAGLPAIASALWRPGSQSSAQHGDLTNVIAVVHQRLPQHRKQRRRVLGMIGMRGRYFARQDNGSGFRECRQFAEQFPKTSDRFPPLAFVRGSRVCWPTLRRVRRINGLLAANPPQLVIHPVIHVAHKLPDGVRNIVSTPSRKLERNVFDASERVSVGGLAVQEFDQDALGHGSRPLGFNMSWMFERRLRHQQHFRVARGIHVVVHAV